LFNSGGVGGKVKVIHPIRLMGQITFTLKALNEFIEREGLSGRSFDVFPLNSEPPIQLQLIQGLLSFGPEFNGGIHQAYLAQDPERVSGS